MDIENHLRLRSFVKPDFSPIYKFILGAAIIHVLFMPNYSAQENKKTAEIPEWINIRLISSSEPVNNKILEKKAIQEKLVKKKVVLPKKTKFEKKNENTKKSKPTTFIAADSKPYLLENPKPLYPNAARKRGMQGIVLLRVDVTNEGYVSNITVLLTSGFNVLDRSAIKSVKEWRFIPAKSGEKNISSKLEIPIKFILN